MRNFCLSIKEFKLGGLFIIRVITINTFLWPIYKAGQPSHYEISALLVLGMTFLSEAPRDLALSLAQSVICTFYFLSVFEPHMYVQAVTLLCTWGFPCICNWIWLFSLVNLSHLNLITDQLKEPTTIQSSFFLLHRFNKDTHVLYTLVLFIYIFNHSFTQQIFMATKMTPSIILDY